MQMARTKCMVCVFPSDTLKDALNICASKMKYLSCTVDVIRVTFLTLFQCHMGKVFHWIS